MPSILEVGGLFTGRMSMAAVTVYSINSLGTKQVEIHLAALTSL